MKEKYEIRNISLAKIRNKNELRVIALLPEVLDEEFSDEELDDFALQDIYALSLNQLPPQYVQPGSIVIKGRIEDKKFREILRQSIHIVLDNPTHLK